VFGASDGVHLGLNGAADVGATTRLEDEKSGRSTGSLTSFERKRLAAEAVPSYVPAASASSVANHHRKDVNINNKATTV